MRFFSQVAQKWGKVDPTDQLATEKWFLEEFPNLPKKDLEAILDELISFNNETNIKPEKLIYPKEIPLPLMKDIVPMRGRSWKDVYKQIVTFLSSSNK